MSYDIWLVIDTGGVEPAEVGRSRNYTSNCAPMWRAAGADLAEFHGKTADECIPSLCEACGAMMCDRATYEAMNPENGWGDYEGCLKFLQTLLSDFCNHPKATVCVSR